MFLGSNRDPGRGMLHPFSPYRVLRCFLAASSPLHAFFKGVGFVGFWPAAPLFMALRPVRPFTGSSRLHARLTPNLCGFGAGSNRFVTASRVHQLGAFLVVRSLFVGVFLGVRSGFMGHDPREFAGSSWGQHQGAPVLNFATSLRARVYEAK